jgi:hypothetical protein
MAAGGCGGGDTGDVQALLDRAFKQDIDSADLKLDAEIEVEGAEGLDRPIRIQADGPFRGNEDKIPSVDLELKISAGAGQTVQTGFLSTGDRAFVKFQDVFYEQPPEQVRQANESIARNSERQSSLGALGLDPRSWLADAQSEGDEEVAGVETEHVSGSLDVAAVVNDFNEFLRKSAGAIGGATGAAPPDPLTDEQIDKVSEVVKDPTFDVYVSKEDDTIRRVSGRVELDVPEEDRDAIGGIEGGTLEFSVEFSDVNGDQQIEAPANARPLSDLTDSLGAGALGGLGGGGESSGGAPLPETPSSPPTTTGPDAEDFERYADCLDKARPEDTEALQRCADVLR